MNTFIFGLITLLLFAAGFYLHLHDKDNWGWFVFCGFVTLLMTGGVAEKSGAEKGADD